MARVILNNEAYNAATDGSEIFGNATGTEQVNVFNGVTGLNISSTVERVDLPGDISEFTFRNVGATLEISDASGNVIGTVSEAGGKQIVFGDGALDVVYDETTGGMTLGGEDVASAVDGEASAPVTPAASEIDTGTTSETANGTVTPGDPVTDELTTAGTDELVGTSGNDTFTGEAGTLQATDTIIDASTSDNDTLNLTLETVPSAGATITNIENINVEIDTFTGTATTFDASNVTGATITLGSSTLGYNGDAGVTTAADNNVTAGTNVDDLTVAGLEAGVVDTGSASAASVTTAAATNDTNVIVNGDIALTSAVSTELNIEATAESTVTLTETGTAVTDITITGADVTLETTAAQVNNDTVTGAASVVVGTAATTDLSDVDAPITLDDDFGGTTVTLADDADVTLGEAQTGTLTVAGDPANATNAATINTGFGLVTLDVSDDGLVTTLNATDDVTIATLTATGEDVVLTGASDVTVTTSDASSLDATSFTGNLTYTTTVSADIVLGTGENDVTLADADTAVTGQGGDDTVDATAITGSTLAAELGAGDDTVELDAPTSTIAVDFGAGSADTLALVDAADLTAASVTLVGLEEIEIENQTVGTADTTAVTVDGSMLSGEAYAVTTAEAADTVTVNVTADEATTDLSSLTRTNIDLIDITGQATAETITGTSGIDQITAGGGADVLTGGGAADTFVFAADASTESALASITDFNLIQFDVLDTASGAVEADAAATDVSAVTSETGDTVTASITDGIMTLAGADAGNIDTLAEWIDAAEIMLDATAGDASALAFEFSGNTYLIENGTDDATDNVIELVGVTGLAALGTAAATDTLVIA